MLRVLHLAYDDRANPWVGGGGAVRAHEIYRRLTGVVDVEVVTGRYPGAGDGVEDGVRYRRVGMPRPYAWSRLTYAAGATRLLQRAPYDAAVFDYSMYTPLRWPASRPVGVFVGVLAGPSASRRFGGLVGSAMAALERSRLRRARHLCAVSHWAADRLRTFIHGAVPITVVQAGVPDALFEIARQDEGSLLYWGRFDVFQKGLDTLLDAMKLLVAGRPGVRLTLAGRGRDGDRLPREIAMRGLEGPVTVLENPTEADRLRLFGRAGVVVMPSRFEGFGMVAAEAMAAGVPVVASAVDSLPEVLGGGRAGRLVAAEDPRELAAAVEGLLADPTERARLGAEARRLARAYRWDSIAQRHLAWLRAVAGGGGTMNSMTMDKDGA